MKIQNIAADAYFSERKKKLLLAAVRDLQPRHGPANREGANPMFRADIFHSEHFRIAPLLASKSNRNFF